jgi:hypothetical protein
VKEGDYGWWFIYLYENKAMKPIESILMG